MKLKLKPYHKTYFLEVIKSRIGWAKEKGYFSDQYDHEILYWKIDKEQSLDILDRKMAIDLLNKNKRYNPHSPAEEIKRMIKPISTKEADKIKRKARDPFVFTETQFAKDQSRQFRTKRRRD